MIRTHLRLGGRCWLIECRLDDRGCAWQIRFSYSADRPSRRASLWTAAGSMLAGPPGDAGAHTLEVPGPIANRTCSARKPDAYSHCRLKEAAEAAAPASTRQHAALQHTSPRGAPRSFYDGQNAELRTCVIPLIGASVHFYGMAGLLRQCRDDEGSGRSTERRGHRPLRDKSSALDAALAKLDGIGCRFTNLSAYDPRGGEVVRLAERMRRLVVKLSKGASAGDRRRAGGHRPFGEIGDRGIPRRGREHPRAGVHQGGWRHRYPRPRDSAERLMAAMQRTGAEGEFRSNLHRGGSARAVAHHARGAGNGGARGQVHGP